MVNPEPIDARTQIAGYVDPTPSLYGETKPLLPVDGMRAPEPNDLIGGATDLGVSFPAKSYAPPLTSGYMRVVEEPQPVNLKFED